MHEFSYNLMKEWAIKYKFIDKQVLDVGSLDINGSYRDIFKNYTGLDIVEGKNVDIVAKNPYKYPLKDNSYEVVISGQTLEHVEDTHKFIKELARVAKEMVCIIVPANGILEHRHPVDCWRVYPDGLRFLFEKIAKLKVIDCQLMKNPLNGQRDTIGLAKKI